MQHSVGLSARPEQFRSGRLDDLAPVRFCSLAMEAVWKPTRPPATGRRGLKCPGTTAFGIIHRQPPEPRASP